VAEGKTALATAPGSSDRPSEIAVKGHEEQARGEIQLDSAIAASIEG
jgi:hypothetical protein